MNSTTPIPVVPGDYGSKGPAPKYDSSAINVAAPAVSLILVLVAIVVWFFLVRKQLLKSAKKNQRRLYNSNLRDSHSRHNSAKGSRLSLHSSPYGTPRTRRKSGGSPKEKHRSCTCTHHEEEFKEMCTCGVPHHHNPVTHTHNSTTQTTNRISTVCTGNSPFCPHSNKMTKHHADIHSRGSSASFEFNDSSPLSEQNNNMFTFIEQRARANTGDYSTLTQPNNPEKNCDDTSMVLRTSPNCTCNHHPLNGFEHKPCSCAVKQHLYHARRKETAKGLYFSAPSLVDKQLLSLC